MNVVDVLVLVLVWILIFHKLKLVCSSESIQLLFFNITSQLVHCNLDSDVLYEWLFRTLNAFAPADLVGCRIILDSDPLMFVQHDLSCLNNLSFGFKMNY